MKYLWDKLFNMEEMKKLSLFWKHMLMMMCILILSLIALSAINQKSIKTLSQELQEKMQISLERDCDNLNNVMYGSLNISSGIENTRYYDYLKGELSGTLDEKYYPVLSLLRDALQNQVYLREGAKETLLYLVGSNSMVGTQHVALGAEDYFGKGISFSETDTQTMLGYLRTRNIQTLLPMQQVKVNNESVGECLTLIIRRLDSNVGIVSIYTRDSIMEYLGLDHFPDGTYWEMRAANGQILAQYPGPVDERTEGDGWRISGDLKNLQVKVDVWVPQSYCSEMMHGARLWGLRVIAVVAVLGLVLACWFSRISVVPIRKLIHVHGTHGNDVDRGIPNEILHLDNILTASKEKGEAVQNWLNRQILARVFLGNILSEKEERQLENYVSCLNQPYRAVVLHGPAEFNAGIGQQLETVFHNGIWTTLSKKETGLIMGSDDAQVNTILKIVETVNEQLTEGGLHCGISAPASSVADLYTAVRQARVALPRERGSSLFEGENSGSYAISWLQHERLYQSIFNNDEEEALRLLNGIAMQTTSSDGREAYYNVRFVLRSAAEEMGVSGQLEFGAEYVPGLLPQENIRNLTELLRAVFAAIREKIRGRYQGWRGSLLDYIRQNIGDPELYVGSVAEHFGVSENRIYETIRTMTNMSFKEYVTDLRMKKAAYLLHTTKDGIVEIAGKCGYRNNSTFYRLFQEYYGTAPGELRKKGSSAQ